MLAVNLECYGKKYTTEEYDVKNRLLLVFEAMNHRTIHARKYENTREIYRNMNFAVLQTLYALDAINHLQYDNLYQKISALECLTINDLYNMGDDNNEK